LAAATRERPSRRNVHQLRVLCRRTTTILWLLDQALDQKPLKKARRSLRKLGRALGDKRQLDIARRDAEGYDVVIPGRRRLQKKAKRAACAALTKKKRARLATHLEAAMTAAGHGLAADMTEPLRALAGTCEPWLDGVSGDREEVHRLRIEMKKIRYALAACGADVAPLKALQDQLGKAHDLHILLTYVDAQGKSERAKTGRAAIERDEAAAFEAATKLVRPAVEFALARLLTQPARFSPAPSGLSPELSDVLN
jgi:CHAD domain-containing protein